MQVMRLQSIIYNSAHSSASLKKASSRARGIIARSCQLKPEFRWLIDLQAWCMRNIVDTKITKNTSLPSVYLKLPFVDEVSASWKSEKKCEKSRKARNMAGKT